MNNNLIIFYWIKNLSLFTVPTDWCNGGTRTPETSSEPTETTTSADPPRVRCRQTRGQRQIPPPSTVPNLVGVVGRRTGMTRGRPQLRMDAVWAVCGHETGTEGDPGIVSGRYGRNDTGKISTTHSRFSGREFADLTQTRHRPPYCGLLPSDV